MPIRTKIAVEADAEKFKASFALFQKYQAALKELHGSAVLKAPYVAATASAGGALLKFLDLDQAARSQTQFATAAQKAAHAFRGLGSGVVRTLEGFARVALSPLEMLFPAGLAVGLFGLGAGLVGAGTFYGLERGAAAVSDRRRQAMGVGVSYGSLSAYDLNFSRFGVGQETLGAVASGIYDFTSPEYIGLRSAGATARTTDEAAIELIRSIPRLFNGVPEGQTDNRSKSMGLDSILDLQTIVRLKNHPEEIEDQVRRYQLDRKTLDISKESQEKWASFDAAISRAGRDIETVLGKNLVALTPGLTKFSDDAVKLIDAFVDSGAMTTALQGIRSGLQWVEDSLGSSEFKHGAKLFLSGLETLGPYIDRFVNGPLAKGLLLTGRGLYYGADLFGNPNYNPSLGGLVGDVLGVKRPSGEVPAPGEAYNRLPSIRNFAGHGSARPAYPSGVIDESTGKLLPRPEFKYSPKAGEVGGISASDIHTIPGETANQTVARIQATYPHLTSEQCVELARKVAGIAEGVRDWRRGVGVGDGVLPAGTPIATFLDRSGKPSQLYDGGQGVGAPGNNTTHAAVFLGYTKDGILVSEQYVGSGGPHVKEYKFGDSRSGEKDAANYNAINDLSGLPAGSHNPFRDEVLAQIASNRFAGSAMSRSSHILDHMDHGPPPGPIVIDNQSGGSVQVTVSRHMASQ
jgi:hypothetical protein